MRFERIGRLVAAALLLWLAAGCSMNEHGQRTKAAYRDLVSSASRLCRDLHPLRSSRLGFTDADSLLFTFSAEETASARDRLRKLEAGLAALPASGLGERERDLARVILNWARGELFALDRLGAGQGDPLLFVWMIEEALDQMPSRLDPPYPGEAEAYRARLARVPSLLANAARSLRNPAEAHTKEAAARVDALVLRFDSSASRARARYGDVADSRLAEVEAGIADFRSYLALVLLPVSRGTLLLGYENLSRVFLYGELFDADPNAVIAEAERRIARYTADRTAMTRRIELERRGGPIDDRSPLIDAKRLPPQPESRRAGGPAEAPPAPVSRARLSTLLAAALDTLWSGGPAARTYGAPHGTKPEIVYDAPIRHFAAVGANPYLSTPLADAPPIAVAVSRGHDGKCIPRILVDPDAAVLGEERLRATMLETSPAVMEPALRTCEARDTVAILFASETYREGHRYFAEHAAVEKLRRDDPSVYIRVLDGWILDLARVIVVIRLHSGTLTTEAAARYLVETAGIDEAAAAREVLAATSSPSLAWPGISMMAVDRMMERLSQPSGPGKPQEEARKLFRQSRGLPLHIIEEKIRPD